METNVNNLDQVKAHHNNPVWIKENAGAVYDLLAKSLKQENEPGEATESLLLMYPFAVTNGEVKRWSKLLQDAILARNHYDFEKMSERSSNPIQQQFMLSEAKEEIEEEFKAAMRRARKRLKPSLILEAYIDLFKSQIYHRENDFTQDMVRSAIKLARQVNLPSSYGNLYLALAFAYTSSGQHHKAIDYGRMAFDYWKTTSDSINTVRSAYIISVAYRHLGSEYDLDDADRWLARAEEMLSKNAETTLQIAILAERGNFLIYRQDYGLAVKLFARALKLSDRIGDAMRTAILQHSMGIALLWEEKYDAGREYLNDSLAYWEEQDSAPQIGHVFHSIGFLEMKRGNTGEAIDLLVRGKDILESIDPLHPYYAGVLNDININLNDLT